MKFKKICAVIFSRANYASLRSLLINIKKTKFSELVLVVGSSAVVDKYGSILDYMKKDGLQPRYVMQNQIEGTSTKSMVKTTGLALFELPEILDKEKPDLVFSVGDRHETISTVIASSYMNIPVAHTMGGEISGSIDEHIRHATTKLAHIHFVANLDSYKRVINLGESKKVTYNVGCPRIDSIDRILKEYKPKTIFKEISKHGSGDLKKIDFNDEFITLLFHPVTTEYQDTEKNFKNVLDAFIETKVEKKIILWPNADAGGDMISKNIRIYRELGKLKNVKMFKNLPLELYIPILDRTKCLIGNSSSALRDGAFIGVRAVNIGTRQSGRKKGPNVVNSSYNKEDILKNIIAQSKKNKAKKSFLYGKPGAARKIIQILKKINTIPVQKKLTF